MSSEIIHKTTLVKSETGAFVEEIEYSSSNCWDPANNCRPRHQSARSFEDSAEGHYAYYVWSVSTGYHVDGGMTKGSGLNHLTGSKAFARWINRGRKVGMTLPRIADPLKTHYHYSKDTEPGAPEFLRTTMIRAMEKRLQANKESNITMPKTFDDGEFPQWMEANRISICDVKVADENPSKTNIVRLFLNGGIAYQFSRGSSRRGTYFDASRIKEFRGVKLVKRWLPDPNKS